MEKELLKPQDISSQLQERLKKLQEILAAKTKSQVKKPKGHLRIAQRNGQSQFYHYTDPKNKKGQYIHKSKWNFAASLAQKDYDANLIKALKKEIEAIKIYLNQTKSGGAIPRLYNKLCPARQSLVWPVTYTDQQYKALWQNESYSSNPFMETNLNMDTSRGEKVRSKSEVIIADTLFRLGVPYRYEFPLELIRGNGAKTTVYPDFLCLNVRTRKELYWEHFGMMDDPDYLKKTFNKMNLYIQHGIFPGKNLIITMETKDNPLNIRDLEKLIKEFLM